MRCPREPPKKNCDTACLFQEQTNSGPQKFLCQHQSFSRPTRQLARPGSNDLFWRRATSGVGRTGADEHAQIGESVIDLLETYLLH